MTRTKVRSQNAALKQFTSTADSVADEVIGAYSTSFGIATRLLGKRHRTHVRNIYALVRVADEIVDGVAEQAGLTLDEQRESLERYVDETHRAMRTGYSPDLVIHAFARTARECDIDTSLTKPFFNSMRADLADQAGETTVFSTEEHAEYVHGSAEVVGLMCVRVFVRGLTFSDDERARLEYGARQLGAAFQNVNFLRDLADDTERLGRSYLGAEHRLTDSDRDRWVSDVREQLADAAAVFPLLPLDARAAVRSAHALFAELTNRVAHTPTAELYRRRVRVPDPVKLRLTSRALIETLKEGTR